MSGKRVAWKRSSKHGWSLAHIILDPDKGVLCGARAPEWAEETSDETLRDCRLCVKLEASGGVTSQRSRDRRRQHEHRTPNSLKQSVSGLDFDAIIFQGETVVHAARYHTFETHGSDAGESFDAHTLCGDVRSVLSIEGRPLPITREVVMATVTCGGCRRSIAAKEKGKAA